MNEFKSLNIRHLAEDDRPREKLLLKGRHVLSDAELLAIILGSGNKEQNAVELAQTILHESENSLSELAKLSVDELKKFKGVGEAKGISIVACLELGRRRKEEQRQKRNVVNCAKDVYDALYADLVDLMHEEFWVLFLNRANEILKKEKLSSGGVSGTVIDPKIVFSKALKSSCSGIILVHNHPSGSLRPSSQDINITTKIKEGGKLLEISILDHLIFTNNGYYSFSDEGIM